MKYLKCLFLTLFFSLVFTPTPVPAQIYKNGWWLVDYNPFEIHRTEIISDTAAEGKYCQSFERIGAIKQAVIWLKVWPKPMVVPAWLSIYGWQDKGIGATIDFYLIHGDSVCIVPSAGFNTLREWNQYVSAVGGSYPCSLRTFKTIKMEIWTRGDTTKIYLDRMMLHYVNLWTGNIIDHFGDTVNTDVREKEFPKQFALYQNYPNPFNPSTTIEYEIKEKAHVKLEIYNALGQICDVLVNRMEYPGRHSERWNPKNIPNGIYFSRLTIGEAQTEVKKMILLK